MTMFAECSAPFACDLTPDERTTIEAAKAILARAVSGRCVISSWSALTDYLSVNMGGRSAECFHVIYLDRQNRLIADVEMGRGTVDHVSVYPREVMRKALELNASAAIIAHNHPSGNTTPSQADISMTKQIQAAADALGVTLHDHVIVGAGGEFSFRASGLI